MARVRIQPGEQPWHWVRDNQAAAASSPNEVPLDTRYRIRETGSETEPTLFEIGYPPDTVIDLHAHSEDEILYVVAGEMHLGHRVAGPGATVFVARDTLYGFKAGPEGVHFLNFRPRQSRTISREDFMKARAQDK